MATLKEALKELYDGFVEENRTPPVTGLTGMSRSQNEAAQLYAAAVSRATGTTAAKQPPPPKPMTSRLVVTPDLRTESPLVTATSAKAAKSDLLSVLANLTPDQVVQGIVLSEILGKPVSRRKGSNRIGR